MERKAFCLNGILIAVVEVLTVLLALGALVSAALFRLLISSNETTESASLGTIPGFILLVLALIMVRGFRMVHPDQALVLFSHHKYLGTIRGGGLIWTNPFADRQRISLQAHHSRVVQPAGDSTSSAPLTADLTWNIKDTYKISSGTQHYEDALESATEKVLSELHTDDPASVDLAAFHANLQQRVEEIGIEIKSVQITQ